MAFGGGGNLILDTAVYLEFLPGKYQWSLTFMAAWWGVGQMVAGLVAWPFLAYYSCGEKEQCTDENNPGWRYTFYTLGTLVFVLSLIRMLVIRLKESPKWLLSQNRDAEVVKVVQEIAQSAGKESPLTLEQLQAIGPVVINAGSSHKYNPVIVWYHIKGKIPPISSPKNLHSQNFQVSSQIRKRVFQPYSTLDHGLLLVLLIRCTMSIYPII